jgi:hypothetical protein
MTMNRVVTRIRSSTFIAGVVWSVAVLSAQTVITPPKNNYTPAQDVELGRQAAAQVEQQLPILHDEDVTSLTGALSGGKQGAAVGAGAGGVGGLIYDLLTRDKKQRNEFVDIFMGEGHR